MSSVTALRLPETGEVFVLSASGDGTIRIWDALDGTCRHTLSGHLDNVNAVAAMAAFPDADAGWSGCRHVLVSGSSDHTVRLWDMTTGRGVVSSWARSLFS